MSDAFQDIVRQAKRWVEQEQAWGRTFYSSPGSTLPRPTSKIAVMPPPVAAQPTLSPEASATSSDKTIALQAIHENYEDCMRCPLGRTRIKFVFGVGNPNSEVMFIGEGPGYEEDRRGEPFVGKAGQLLDKILASIGLSRQTNAYIANIVKCHPLANPETPEARGNDRPPTPDEVAASAPILLRQIAVIQPKIIVTLGSPSTRMILRTKDGITQLRGKFFPFAVDDFYPEGGAELIMSPTSSADDLPPVLDQPTREALRRIQVLPTYHPAALLRNPNLKPDTWSDMKLLRDTLGLKK